jgi:hypothetical protein
MYINTVMHFKFLRRTLERHVISAVECNKIHIEILFKHERVEPVSQFILHLIQQLQKLKPTRLSQVLTKCLQILTLDIDEGW